MAALQKLITKLHANGSLSAALTHGGGLGPLLGFQTNVYYHKSNNTDNGGGGGSTPEDIIPIPE